MWMKWSIPLFLALALQAGPPKGTLVIMGGGDETPGIVTAFAQAAGGKGGLLGIIPTPSAEPDRSYKPWKAVFDQAGLASVPLDVRRREDSSLPELLAAAGRCTAFWFTGGDQARVGDKIVGTPLHKLIQEKYRDGAGVGGSSAGAAIMSRIMLTGDDRNGKEALVEMGPGAYKTREGMGFLPEGVIVDQHFLRRNWQNRLLSLMMEHPDHLGLGIDEATALVVKDGVAKVVGRTGVLVFDPQGMSLQGGGFRNLTIHFLREGQGIDLSTRKLLP